MLYFWCWIFPPVAVLLCGKPFRAFLNLCLFCTVLGIPFAIFWGYLTVAEHNVERRTDRLVRAVERGRDNPWD